jgi:hypothetical protein
VLLCRVYQSSPCSVLGTTQMTLLTITTRMTFEAMPHPRRLTLLRRRPMGTALPHPPRQGRPSRSSGPPCSLEQPAPPPAEARFRVFLRQVKRIKPDSGLRVGCRTRLQNMSNRSGAVLKTACWRRLRHSTGVGTMTISCVYFVQISRRNVHLFRKLGSWPSDDGEG